MSANDRYMDAQIENISIHKESHKNKFIIVSKECDIFFLKKQTNRLFKGKWAIS